MMVLKIKKESIEIKGLSFKGFEVMRVWISA
ncbi:hypothetical protein J2756_000077 [Methanobacterium aggregans]|nr:hypothetical protein [Methanobacterium aggregans]